MRNRWATEAGAPDPRQRQFAVAVLIAVVAATAIGFAFDLQTPALIAGLTAVFGLVAAGGQALEPDLHRFAWFSPVLVLVMVVGPLSRDVPVLAGLLVAVVVLGAGMLPALGEHYRIGGQTIAAATIVSTTTGIGAGEPAWLLFTSAVAGTAFGLALRVVNGLTDPRRNTRGAVARTLLEPGPGVLETAAAAWRADGATVWLGEVLAGAARLRAARETLLAQAERSDEQESDRLHRIVDETDAVAAELARAVRARACSGLPVRARRDPAEAVLLRGGRRELPEAVQGIREGLDRIRGAVLNHDRGQVPAPARGARRERITDAVHAHLSLRSSLFRHALRCTLAVAVGMVVVLLLDDPSASGLLLALYLVLQPAARDSMTGALERTGAAVLGVTALALLITLLPWVFLLVPLLITGMLLNTDRLRGDYQLLLGCLIAVTVVDQALALDRELINVCISFAANTAVGAAIALFVGFISYLVLASSVLPDVRGSVRSAVWAVSELVRSVQVAGSGPAPSDDLRAAHVLALRRTQDLLGMPALLDGTGEETDDGRSTRDAATALDALRQNVATLAFRPEHERELARPALSSVDDLLVGKTAPRVPDVPPASAPAGELLAGSLVENALHARAAIDRTLGHDDPWKNYAISFIRQDGAPNR